MRAENQLNIDRHIDFSKYQRPELVDSLVDVTSVAGSIFPVLRWMAALLFLLAVVIPVLARSSGGAWLGVLPAAGWGVFCGFSGGLLLGLLELGSRRIENVQKIVEITLDISEQVLVDIGDVWDGKTALPPTSEIIHSVHTQVIEPTLEKVIQRKFPLGSWFTIRFYRYTVGRALKRVILKAPHDQPPANPRKPGEGPDLEPATTPAQAAELNRTWISQIRDYVMAIGTRLRWIVLGPIIFMSTLWWAALLAPYSFFIYLALRNG